MERLPEIADERRGGAKLRGKGDRLKAMEPKVQNVAFAMARHAQRRPIALSPRTPS
jgi:hypothetical protein